MEKPKKKFWKRALCVLTLIALFNTMPEGFSVSGFSTDAVYAADAAPLPDSYKFYVDGTTIKCDFQYGKDRVFGQYLYLEYAESKDGPWHEAAHDLSWSADKTRTLTWNYPDIGTTYYVRLRAEMNYYYYYDLEDVETISDVKKLKVSAPKLDPPEWVLDSCRAYINTCRLTWKIRRDEKISYNIYRSTKKGSGYEKIATLPVKVLATGYLDTQQMTYYDTTAKPKTTYYYKIATVNSEGKAGKKSGAIKLKTAKDAPGSDSVKIPDFASYAGIEGVETTEKNLYGEKYNKIVYTNVEKGMFDGYVKLLQDSYPFQKIRAPWGLSYYFDYTGTKDIKRGRITDEDVEYERADVAVIKQGTTLILEYSPSLKPAKVKKDKRYDPSAAGNANADSGGNSSGTGSGGIGTVQTDKTCTACGGTGSVICHTCGASGYVTCSACNGTGTYYSSAYESSRTCTGCGGTGRKTCSSCSGMGKKNCSSCNGTGKHW